VTASLVRKPLLRVLAGEREVVPPLWLMGNHRADVAEQGELQPALLSRPKFVRTVLQQNQALSSDRNSPAPFVDEHLDRNLIATAKPSFNSMN
jgi:hypothetical protein